MDYRPNFLRALNTIYEKPQETLKIKNTYVKTAQIKRSALQGFHAVFTLAIELMARVIREKKLI